MKALVPLLLSTMLLSGCQVYVGGGSMMSDGRTTTVRTAESELGTETGSRTRSTRTVIREE